MATVKFKGIQGEDEIREITMFGYTFAIGKAVKIPSDSADSKSFLMMLKGHPHFDVKTTVSDEVEDVKFTDIPPATPVPEAPQSDDAFVAVGSSRSDGLVQTQDTLDTAIAAYEAKNTAAPTHDELVLMANALGMAIESSWDDETLKAKIEEKVEADKK